MLGTPVARGRPRLLHRLGQAAASPLRARPWSARRRPWWKWALIGLLLAGTLAVTAVYATTLARDVVQQHWANALDASREAVLAVVGWAAVIIVLSPEDDRNADPARAGDSTTAGEHPDQPAGGADWVPQAQDRVRRLRARLAELDAARERAGSGADPDLDRELASTAARLEQARQWLSSAQSARTVGKPGGHSAAHRSGETRADARRQQRPPGAK